MPPHVILIGTNNAGKMREIQSLLGELDLVLLTPAGLDLRLCVKEDGTTYAENAAEKAIAYSRASGLVTLADDSGLEVDALDGEPGLHSARYAPIPGASDADRRRYLLHRLQGKPRPWTACFHATVAIAVPGADLELTTGQCPGEIIPEERGNHGFGYDPIFLLSVLGKTMAELSMEEKNRLSHRALAIRKALPILKRIFV